MSAWKSSYSIVRFFQHHQREIIKRGLTLDQARAHCNDPETSSSTCKEAAGKLRTETRGPWFDGYTKEE